MQQQKHVAKQWMACGVVIVAMLLMGIMTVVMVRFIIFITKKPVVMICQAMKSVSIIPLLKDVVRRTVLLQFIL